MRDEMDEYLNIWARQLVAEHASICWQYGLKLSRPMIEVVEMPNCWGRWLEHPTTISMATALILSKPWDIVINVLKHEMAHQLVSEVLGGKPGHGKDFGKACQILGVMPPFSRASGDLPESLDSAYETMETETGRLLEKIRKLLALGGSANEHESLLAIRKARTLMERHRLDERSVMQEQGCTGVLINLKRKRLESYHRAICSILQEYFQVKIIIVPLYDAGELTTYRNIDIIGRAESVKVAEYVFHFLLDRLSILWQTKKRSDHSLRASGKNSYWLGVLNGFQEALRKEPLQDSTPVEPPCQTGISTVLPVPDNDQLLRSFIKARHPKLNGGRNRKIRIDSTSFESGMKDGRLLKLHRGINTGEGVHKTYRLPLIPTGS
jgi:hypothetical protein